MCLSSLTSFFPIFPPKGCCNSMNSGVSPCHHVDSMTISGNRYQTWNIGEQLERREITWNCFSGERIYHFRGYEKPSAIATAVTGYVVAGPRPRPMSKMAIGLLPTGYTENLPQNLYSICIQYVFNSSTMLSDLSNPQLRRSMWIW